MVSEPPVERVGGGVEFPAGGGEDAGRPSGASADLGALDPSTPVQVLSYPFCVVQPTAHDEGLDQVGAPRLHTLGQLDRNSQQRSSALMTRS